MEGTDIDHMYITRCHLSIASVVPDIFVSRLLAPRVLLTSIGVAGALLLGANSHAEALNTSTAVDEVHQKMIYKASDLAKEPYQSHQSSIPLQLQELGYDKYRDIRFLKDKALWKDESAFEIQLFHPGFLYKEPVSIYEVIEENINNIPFSNDYFRYDGESHEVREIAQPIKTEDGVEPENSIQFSGLRVHYPLNNERYKDELIVFQGASYFRPLGPGFLYGVSGRGLAIDTAEPSGEEFPHFTEFWLVRPSAKSDTMIIYALLDSPSVTGAYQFKLKPGLPTKIEVAVNLFPRKDINKLGIAPLTSMFFFGENSVNPIDDFRPEVHDSDGLLIQTKQQEWIWRPLSNPKSLRISSFSNDELKGFGLMQRDRDFYRYQDTEAHYHRRPSLWVTPRNKSWGKGRVELVEIPTQDETNDNIVAYWVPEKPLIVGQELRLSYDLTITDSPQPVELGKVVQTRNGWGAVPGPNPPPKSKRQFIVDFAGWPDGVLNSEMSIEAKLSHTSGTITDVTVYPLPDKKTWRASFKLEPIGNIPIDMNLSLMLNKQKITETWSYVWYPEDLD